MKNKKVLIFGIIVIILVGVGFCVVNILSSNLFNKDGSIVDGHKELIQHLRSIENQTEKSEQINYCINQNLITQNEADKLY